MMVTENAVTQVDAQKRRTGLWWALAALAVLAVAGFGAFTLATGQTEAEDARARYDEAASGTSAALTALVEAQAEAEQVLAAYVAEDLDEPELRADLSLAVDDSQVIAAPDGFADATFDEVADADAAAAELTAVTTSAQEETETLTALTGEVDDSAHGEVQAAAAASLSAALTDADDALDATADGHTWDEDARTALESAVSEAQAVAESDATATAYDATTASVTGLTATVADSARALLSDADGRWCTDSPYETYCVTITSPEVLGDGFDTPWYVYPLDYDYTAGAPDSSTDFTDPDSYVDGGCLMYLEDGYPATSGAQFLYCPAGATLPDPFTDPSGAGTDVERIYMTQDTESYPYLREDA